MQNLRHLLHNLRHRSRRHRILVAFAAVCLWTALAAPVHAGGYAVEVVVFSHDNPDLEAGELWVRTYRRSLQPDAGHREPEFLPLGRLAGPMQALEQTPGYKVLSHVAWAQDLVVRAQAPLVAVAPTIGSGGALSFLEPEVTGYVRLHGTSQLQLEVDIVHRPVDGVGLSGALDAGYVGVDEHYRAAVGDPLFIQTRRRVRLNEVHYFDHPRFGVLAVVYSRGN